MQRVLGVESRDRGVVGAVGMQGILDRKCRVQTCRGVGTVPEVPRLPVAQRQISTSFVNL